MKGKKEIGLVTWLGGPNYGTVLQSYALFMALQALGCEVTVIRREPFVYGLKLKFGISRKYKGSTTAAKSSRLQRNKLNTKTFCTKTGFSLFCRKMDAFVCGSDQMWNTYFGFDPFSFLAFAGKRPRISYAPSIGTMDFDPRTKDKVKEYLQAFTALSVREESGRKAVEMLTGRKDVACVLDPVFLHERDFWENFATKPEMKGYLLCYLLKDRDNHGDLARQVAAQCNCNGIVVVASWENHDICIDGAETIRDAGPEEFVGLIANAGTVLTDSFHGVSFALIFGKDPVVLKRFDDGDSRSQNSRIDNLLDLAGITGRDPSRGLLEPVDWNIVNRNLEKARNHSIEYLKTAIGNV